MRETRSGGCLCGAVRYEVAWPPLGVSACHCTHCQKQSGSAFSIIARVPREALEVTGILTDFYDTGESGSPVIRRFCAKCGSPLISEIQQEPLDSFFFIKTGTLDDTSSVVPTSHWWTSRAQDWFKFPDGAVIMDRQ
ncbi:GFA family protein [Sphingorhabdus contaminans]|nr:GFA family protein [Sphingorhabdus contaminans]